MALFQLNGLQRSIKPTNGNGRGRLLCGRLLRLQTPVTDGVCSSDSSQCVLLKEKCDVSLVLLLFKISDGSFPRGVLQFVMRDVSFTHSLPAYPSCPSSLISIPLLTSLLPSLDRRWALGRWLFSPASSGCQPDGFSIVLKDSLGLSLSLSPL